LLDGDDAGSGALRSVQPNKELPMSKKSTSKKSKTMRQHQLDEQTSAMLIAEYLSITKIAPAEIKALESGAGKVNPRQAAVAMRMSEVLDIPYPFEIAARYRRAFELARSTMAAMKMISEQEAAAN
jgi:hypothetical protein